jgi:hypothetical protein
LLLQDKEPSPVFLRFTPKMKRAGAKASAQFDNDVLFGLFYYFAVLF